MLRTAPLISRLLDGLGRTQFLRSLSSRSEIAPDPDSDPISCRESSLDRVRDRRLTYAFVDEEDDRVRGVGGDLPVVPLPPPSSEPGRARRAKPAVSKDGAGEPARPIDAAQLQLARGNKRAAVESLMNVHGEMIFAHCIRTLRDRNLAEDVLQQVFLEAYRDLDKFRGQSSLGTWLFSIAAHRCADVIKTARRRGNKVEPDEDALTSYADPATAPGERLDQARLVEALEGCLEELSPEVSATVLLRFQSGLTYEEMAAELDTKADTLCARVARALPFLKRCLERKGWHRE
jgi:RNA polymerase sigma-70 factor (ECF subfamily)